MHHSRAILPVLYNMWVLCIQNTPYLVFEKNRKKGKLGLDKHVPIWYNKSCVEREHIKQSASILENDTVK